MHSLNFSAIYYNGNKFLWLPVCFPVHRYPSEKMSTLEGKNLLPLGANSFEKEDTSSKRQKQILTVISLESVSIHLNSFPASGNFCHLLINFANSLDPDQA